MPRIQQDVAGGDMILRRHLRIVQATGRGIGDNTRCLPGNPRLFNIGDTAGQRQPRHDKKDGLRSAQCSGDKRPSLH